MSKYNVVTGSLGPRKSFQVVCGLRIGYGADAVTHTGEEALEAYLNHLKFRAAAGQPYLTGTVVPGEVVYAWPEGPGKAVVQGEVNPLFNKDLLDDRKAVVEILNELGSALGAVLGQTRVYLAYDGEMWILEKEKGQTPTGN